MTNKYQAIELLECAKVNADNIEKVGIIMIDVIKEQIDSAIKLLESEEEDE